MHLTNSIDYGIVLAGEIEIELDDGVMASLGGGDIVIRRGSPLVAHRAEPRHGASRSC